MKVDLCTKKTTQGKDNLARFQFSVASYWRGFYRVFVCWSIGFPIYLSVI